MKHEEDKEQAKFIRYLEEKGLRFSATAQNTYTPYFSQINKNKMLGVRKGVPDVLVIVPTQIGKKLVFVEMKAAHGRLSPEQKDWLNDLTECGVTTACCYGALEAMALIEAMLAPEYDKIITPFEKKLKKLDQDFTFLTPKT